MKTRFLIIVLITIVTAILTILGISYIQFEAELEDSIQNSSWVKDCIPTGPSDYVASIGIENKTHHFDLRSCIWLTNDESMGSNKLDEGLDVGWITGEDYCGDWCDQEELYKIGCDKPILAHLTKYSNLLDEEFNGKYAMEDIGLSDGVSVEKFNECVDFIYEKRISSDSESLNKKWGELYLEYQLLKESFSDHPNNMTTIERMAEIDDETMRIATILSEREFTIDVPGMSNGNATSDDSKHDALNSKGCPQFCSKKVANNVFSFCGGDGFYSEGYMFTNNSTHYFDHNECEWIQNENSEPLDIASIEDGHIRLNPVDTCARIDIDRLTLDELNQRYPATYTTKSGKTYENKFLSIDNDDLKEMPVISELIRATHHIPFSSNNGISASKGLIEDPDWNDYREWYDQKKTEQFNLDKIRVSGFVYNEEYYSIGFSIC